MHLSRRAQQIPASVTLALDARVAELRAAGTDVLSMAAGQPDFPGPPEAAAAAQAFLAESGGRVGYTPTPGIPALREAAAEHVSQVTGVTYAPNQLVVTCGAKEAVSLAIAAVADAGEDVLVPTPSWLSYEPMALIANANAVKAVTDDTTGFKLTPEVLAAAITPKTRAIILNSPSNPTGAVYTRDELAALVPVLQDADRVVISDEIYWPFVYDGEFVSPASLPGMAERTIVVNGVSKTFAMTGWRVGFLAAPPAFAKAMGNMKSHLTSNASAPAQHAALGALRSGDAHTLRMRDAFAGRRTLALDALAAIDGVSVVPPAGAFYVFPRVDAFYSNSGARPLSGSVEFCQALLEDAQVAAVPGAAFDEDRCIRLSIAASDEVLSEALRRLAGFVDRVRPEHSQAGA